MYRNAGPESLACSIGPRNDFSLIHIATKKWAQKNYARRARPPFDPTRPEAHFIQSSELINRKNPAQWMAQHNTESATGKRY